MSDELIINLAPTGMVPTRADSPHVPLTPDADLGAAMGGHVRVGLEENLWPHDDRTQLATNPMLVERIVGIARAMGREPASPALVRERLRIPSPLAEAVA